MIRIANIKDVKIIHSLLLEGISSGKVLYRSIAEIKKVIKSFFIYEEDGKIVGCCSLEIYNQKIAEIRSLVVTSKHRYSGIGSKLIKRCLDEAKKKDIYHVLSVTDKCDLFERFGFSSEFREKQAMLLKIN